MPQTPIAVFLYKRPNHAKALFDSLRNCSRLNECNVYIYCDGVKNPLDLSSIQETRFVAREFAFRYKAIVEESEHNIGLAGSIVGGVSKLCALYGRVIVLEDDFILHPFFLDYMLQSLDRYAENEQVAQVAGFSFPINYRENSDAYFLPLTTSWGWATWQRAWNLFSWDTSAVPALLNTDLSLKTSFNLDGAYPYADMMRLAVEGRLDSWAIRWYWQTFLANKITLYPRRSLVWQNGFDESATHTTSVRPDIQASFDDFIQEKWNNPILFPDVIEPNKIAFQLLKDFLSRKSFPSLLQRAKQFLQRKKSPL